MKTAAERRAYNVEYQRRLREKDRAAHNAYHLANYHRKREREIAVLGGKCQDCETTDRLDITANGLLCKSCAMKRRKRFTHGTYYGFAKAKCSCDACSEKRLTYNEERNRKRRKYEETWSELRGRLGLGGERWKSKPNLGKLSYRSTRKSRSHVVE